MVEECPVLTLFPVLEGEGATSPRTLEENFRLIAEWTRLMCSYVKSVARMSMGELSAHNNAIPTVISNANTWTKVEGSSNLSVEMDFDSPVNERIRYVGEFEKLMHCGCTVSIEGAASNNVVAIALYKNGTTNVNGEFITGERLTAGVVVRKLAAAGDVGSSAIHVMTSMQDGDYLELAVENRSGTGNVTFTDTNLFVVGMRRPDDT